MENEQDFNTGDNETYYLIPEDDSKPMNLFQRLAGIFFSPQKLMENIDRHPKVLSLALIFVIIGAALLPISRQLSSISLTEQTNYMIERFQADYSDLGELGADETELEDIQSLIGFTVIVSMVTSSVISPFMVGIFSAIGLSILAFIFRLRIKFTQFYSMFVHTAVITSVIGLISSYFTIFTGSSTNIFSIAAFLKSPSVLDPIYTAMSAVSAASVWQAVLMTVGVKTFTGCSTAKASSVSAVFLIFTVIFAAAFAAATQMYLDIFSNINLTF